MNTEQKNIIIVNDPKVVKLLEKQLIKKILACFNNSPKTASQISNTVSFPKDKIYYHIKNLIANNILYVVSTKKIKGIDQKEFLPTAKEFKIESVSKSETNNLKYDEKKVNKTSFSTYQPDPGNNKKDVIQRKIQRRRSQDRRVNERRIYKLRRIKNLSTFRGNEKRSLIEKRKNLDQRVHLERREMFDRRYLTNSFNESLIDSNKNKGKIKKRNISIPFKNILLKMRGVNEAISFVYDSKTVTVLHCKLNLQGFEIYSSNKYEFPIVIKEYTINTLPEFISNIISQIIPDKKKRKVYISIHSEKHQYEMTYFFEKNKGKQFYKNEITKSFSIKERDLLYDEKRTKEKYKVKTSLIFTRNKDIVSKEVNELEKNGINTRYNTSIPKIIQNIYTYYNLNNQDEDSLLIYIGRQKTHLVRSSYNEIVGSSDFSKGLHFFSDRLIEITTKSLKSNDIYLDALHYLSFYGIDGDASESVIKDGFPSKKAQSILIHLVKDFQNNIINALNNIYPAIENSNQELLFTKAYIYGPGSHIKNLQNYISSSLKCGVERINDISEKSIQNTEIGDKNFLFKLRKSKVFKKRDNSNNQLNSIKKSIQKKKLAIETVKSPESVKYKLARLEIEKSTKIKSIDDSTKKLVFTAKEFKDLKKDFSSKHKILNADLKSITKTLEDQGALLLNNYREQEDLKEQLSEVEFISDQNSDKRKKLRSGYKNQYQAKIKVATNSRYKLSDNKEKSEEEIDILEQKIIQKQDDLQVDNLKLENAQSELANYDYLKNSIQRITRSFKKSFIDRVRILENISQKDLNTLNEASYLIIQNTTRINNIKETFTASLNGEINHDNYIDGDEGDSTKRSLIKILKLVLEVPDSVTELKTFFSTIIKINQEQNGLKDKKEEIKNKIKKVSINQKDFKQSLLVLSNKLINNEKDLRKKEDKRADLQQLLTYIRETIENLNAITFQSKFINELKPQIKISKKEIKALEANIIKLKGNVELKEKENNKISIELKRVQNTIENEAISKQDELDKYEAENEILADTIEEKIHFIKETKKEVLNAKNYSGQLEKNILNKKRDLEDLNEEKVLILGKYSKEENLLKNQYDRLIKNINQKKNQKIKESEKTKNITIKTFFQKEEATLKKKSKSISSHLTQLDREKNQASKEKQKIDALLMDKKKKQIPEISKLKENIKSYFRDLKKGRKIEQKLILLEDDKADWDLLLKEEENNHKSRIKTLQTSIDRKKSPSYIIFVKEGISRFNKMGDPDEIAKSMANESIQLDLKEIKKEETSFFRFKSRYDLFMKKYRKSHREISIKIKPFGGREKTLRKRIKAAESKIKTFEDLIEGLTVKLEAKDKLFIEKKRSLEKYIDQGNKDLERIKIQLINIPEKQSRAEYDIDKKTAVKIASIAKEKIVIEKEYKTLIDALNAKFKKEKIIVETSNIENQVLKELEEIDKTHFLINDLKTNIKDLERKNQLSERKLKRQKIRALEFKELIKNQEKNDKSFEDELILKKDLNTKNLLKKQSLLINTISKCDDLKEAVSGKIHELNEAQKISKSLQEKVEKAINKSEDELLLDPASKKKLSKFSLNSHQNYMFQIEKDILRNIEQSENSIYKINSILDANRTEQNELQSEINLTINDLSYFEDDQKKIENLITANSKYIKDIKHDYNQALDLILNLKDLYPSIKIMLVERISKIHTLIDIKLKESELIDAEIDDLKKNLRVVKVDIALIDEELSKINSQMKQALEKSFYEDENKNSTYEWEISDNKIESYSNIAKLKTRSKELFKEIVEIEEGIALLKHKQSSTKNLISESEKLSQDKIKKMEEVCTTLELQITKEKHEIIGIEEEVNELKGLAFNYGDRLKKLEKELKDFRVKEMEQKIVLRKLDRSIDTINNRSDLILRKDKSKIKNTIEVDYMANLGLLMDPFMELNLLPEKQKKDESYLFTNKIMQNVLVLLLLVFSISSFLQQNQIKPIEAQIPIKKAELKLLNMRRDIKEIVEKENVFADTYQTIIKEDSEVSLEMIRILKYFSNKVPKGFNVTELTLDKLQSNYFQASNNKENNSDIIITLNGFFNKSLESSILLAENFKNDLDGSGHFKIVELSAPDIIKKYRTGFDINVVY